MKRESSSYAFLIRFVPEKHVYVLENMVYLKDGVENDTERTECVIQDALMQN